MNKKTYDFDAELKATKNGAYVEFPYDVQTEFGTKGRISVSATFDSVPYRGILVKMSTDCHIIGVLKDIRAKIGKEVGDFVHVTIEQDVEKREKELPEQLSLRLHENEEAEKFFLGLTDSQKNKFIDFIQTAKQEATKQSRLERVMTMLLNKEKMK